MPVTIPPVDREARTALGQLSFEGSYQGAVLIVDRGLSAEMVIMFGDLEQPRPRNASAAQHVFEKRNDVFTLLRSAEGDQQQRVVSRTVVHILHSQFDTAC